MTILVYVFYFPRVESLSDETWYFPYTVADSSTAG